MADIARAIGITKSAVSLALRNHPRIPEARRKEIQAMAERMGYRPIAEAATLAHFRHHSRSRPVQAELAWVNAHAKPELLRANYEYQLYWKGASATAEKFGFHLEEFMVNDQFSLPNLEKVLLTRNIHGIILAPLLGDQQLQSGNFDWNQFSIIRLGRRTYPPHSHFVTSAQAANAMLAFEEMRERGYRRIAFVGEWDKPRMFGAGFLWSDQESSREAQLPPFLLRDPTPSPRAQAKFERWLAANKPDAILADTPQVTRMLIHAGARIPQDIAVAATSIHDIPGVDAGIEQNSGEIGRMAVLALISLMHDNEQGIPKVVREILIRGKWVDGHSLPRRPLL